MSFLTTIRISPISHEEPRSQAREKKRPLTEKEARVLFEKISKHIGENLQLLLDRLDGTYFFQLHKDQVYYLSEMSPKLDANISRIS